ncbi:putative T7SS-secreted protein [Streptomyces sp. 7-21]|uniref:putative T7SS-secreted protein n=1 Tax=Streptomyces sp. 7-21 TaxID=2802283 RepID=UPI00191ED6B2|nr:DUF6531 domain-containing protein [Streptomyces sp. 7-21]MBL1065208.1 type IV secretion protein Rhs [Streptomyces sp. 7-21]
MGWLDDLTPDFIEEAAEFGTELIGEGVEELTNWGADRLEDFGADGAANWLRETGTSAANRLGADVSELSLGQTDDPKKLIYGSPGKLRSTAAHLRVFADAFADVGAGLRGLNTGELRGLTADAFQETISIEPQKWFTAEEACRKAAEALSGFADTVEWAQGRAQEAIDLYDEAQRVSDEARAEHDARVEAYNQAVEEYYDTPEDERAGIMLPPCPTEFEDPGPGLRQEAEEILTEARAQRDEARTRAVREIDDAREMAPPKPSYGEQAGDAFTRVELASSHFAGGMLRGASGLVNTVRGVNPLDPYNLTHPAEYLTHLNSTALGLMEAQQNPVGTASAMAESFQGDPAEGAGRLVPELIGLRGAGRGAGTAGRGAGTAGRGAGTAGRAGSSPSRGRAQAREDGPGTHSTPDRDRVAEGTDPVDLATGRMFLPQTDVELPGALPLAFRRRVESGYRAGRWFGPSWSSTVDERLEIDAEGVVYLSEDGLVLTYPHPAPGVPTLPQSGPGWPLERTPGGDYMLTHPDTGVTRRFAGPLGPGGETGADGEAPLAEISDRNGDRVTLEYDEDGTPLGLVHSGGYHLKLTVRDGRVTALSLAGAADGGGDLVLVRYGYTGGDLTEVINSSGLPLRFDYDDQHRVVAWTDTNGCRYDYVYDASHRCVAEGGTEGHLAVRIAYGEPDPLTGLRHTTLTTADGHTTRYTVDRDCRVIAATDPLGRTTRTSYDARGRVTSRTDALGHTTAYEYDERGNLTAITLPDGRQATASYNSLNLPVEITEPGGRATWRQEYDERGNRTAVTGPDGQTTRYAYDARGHLAAVTDALGHTTRVRCDAAGLPVEITDPLGGTTVCRRDAFGRPVAVTDPAGATERMAWTPEGRLARHVDGTGAEQTWEYDGEGNCVRHVNAAGGVTTFAYTHFDLLAARTEPDGTRYEFTHDSQLRLRQVTNPAGLTWTYEYDAAGQLAAETDFDGRTLRYAYDATGALVSRTNPLGQTVTLGRDALGRVVRKDADGQVTTYSYDAAGRLAAAEGPDATLTLRRDEAGRVTEETTAGRTLTYAYDALGRIVTRTTPSGAVSRSSYDAAGRRTQLVASGHALSFSHDASGRETVRRIGDVLTLSQDWDAAGRLTAQTLTGPSSRRLRHRTYTYRPDGYLTWLHDDASGDWAFTLDPAGRVTGVRAEGWRETYAYDAAGNQTHAVWPSHHAAPDAVGPRAYTGNRLTRAGRLRYEYDAAGRVVVRRKSRLSKKPDIWRYEWDAEDRLTAVITPDGTRWRYRYDPLGRRIAKERLAADDATVVERTRFSWDNVTLAEQITEAPELPLPVTLTWDHDGFRPLAQTERRTAADDPQHEIDRRFFAIVTDLTGTPTDLVDESGTTAWRTRSTLWGTTAWSADATAYTPLRFPGQYYDPETGLHYNLYRHYDPTTARYLTPDPLGLAPAPNPQTYVHNPHTWTDPLGLTPCSNQEWAERADFSDRRTMNKKYDRHAEDFGITGNRNNQRLREFEQAMREHIASPDTTMHRFNWRNQGEALAFFNKKTGLMVMLHDDGRFWSCWKPGKKQRQAMADGEMAW